MTIIFGTAIWIFLILNACSYHFFQTWLEFDSPRMQGLTMVYIAGFPPLAGAFLIFATNRLSKLVGIFSLVSSLLVLSVFLYSPVYVIYADDAMYQISTNSQRYDEIESTNLSPNVDSVFYRIYDPIAGPLSFTQIQTRVIPGLRLTKVKS